MRLVGSKVPRVEDRRILTGSGRYIDDITLPGMLHAAFLRSPMAHAVIAAIDVEAARRSPGVVGVLTGDDMSRLSTAIPITMARDCAIPTFHALATDRVRYVGDPIAIVVAGSRYQAEDAAELIDVEYDPLPVVVDYAAALDPDGSRLFDDLDSNVVATSEISVGDVDAALATADHVISISFTQHRVAPVPMETRGAIADFDPGTGELTFHSNTQAPHGLRLAFSDVLGLPSDRVRVLTHDIGGAFGLKSCFGREDFCLAAASRLLGKPVKWIEDRSEHLIAAGHAREETADVTVGVMSDGTLVAMRVELTLDQGAYPGAPFPAASVTTLAQILFPGPYRWQAYDFHRTVVATNKCTYLAYRGPWEIETWARERMLDEVARRLEIDPAELRRRNLQTGQPDDRLITGLSLSGVTNLESLDLALAQIDYDAVRRRHADARAEGRCVGIGMATFIEPAPGPVEMRAAPPFGGESARVKLEPDGRVLVTTSQVPHGQGHETTLAQLVADEMGVPFEHVRVLHGDTRQTPFKYIGTAGSLAATWASGAVIVSTRKLKHDVLAIAGAILEASPDDLDIVDGRITPRDAPARAIALAQVAMQATLDPGSVPAGIDSSLEALERFTGEGVTGSGWSGGTHAVEVEIDLETGRVTIVRYVVAEDCGRIINPGVVDGQIRGGVAQGIGEVLYERAIYDDDGNFLTTTFMDYLLPTSAEIPHIEIHHMESDPDGPIGFRGVGEGGAIVAPAALTNAIADALAPLGGVVNEQYLPPATILALAGVVSDD